MENNKNQKKISIVIYTILFAIIIGLSITLYYFNDLYKEYTIPYNENCYKVEYDENSITITTYHNASSEISTVEKYNVENGKLISVDVKEVFKNKSLAKRDYESILNSESEINFKINIKLKENELTYTHNLLNNVSYDSEEIKEKFESFTTNEEIINYLLEDGEKNNFWISNEYKRIN